MTPVRITSPGFAKRPSTDKAAVAMRTGLAARFARAQAELSGSRERLLRMIIKNPADTFFLSSRRLAKRYKVDAATMVRTIQALGYAKFADLAADLRAHFITQITAALRAKKQGIATFGIANGADTPIARICDDFCTTSVISVSFANSYVAPRALLGTILAACAHTRTARTLAFAATQRGRGAKRASLVLGASKRQGSVGLWRTVN